MHPPTHHAETVAGAHHKRRLEAAFDGFGGQLDWFERLLLFAVRFQVAPRTATPADIWVPSRSSVAPRVARIVRPHHLFGQ